MLALRCHIDLNNQSTRLPLIGLRLRIYSRWKSCTESEIRTMKKRFATTDAAATESMVPHHQGSFQSYMTNKIAKLSEQNNLRDEVQSIIFRGCFVYVNGATNPPSTEIRRLVALHGGAFCGYLTGSVTHIVCDHFTDAQLKQQSKKRRESSQIYYVSAEWILQSIARGKRQPEAQYLPSNHWSRNVKQSSIASMLNGPQNSRISNDVDSSNIVVIDMVSPSPPPTKQPKTSTDVSYVEPEQFSGLQTVIDLIHGSNPSGKGILRRIAEMVDCLVSTDFDSLRHKCNIVTLYGKWLIQQELFQQVHIDFHF